MHRCPANTYHSQVLKRPSSLNILERLLQILQLRVHLALSRLRTLHSLSLEGLDRLQLPAHIILLWLESRQLLLDVVDDGSVAELGAVGGEVDLLRLVGKDLDFAARVVVALFEGCEGLGGAAFDAELSGKIGPVDFEGGGALYCRCD